MKAIVYTKYGPPDVLQLQDIPKPSPKQGEVLIRMGPGLSGFAIGDRVHARIARNGGTGACADFNELRPVPRCHNRKAISDEGWRRYFGRDPNVLGRTIFLNNDAWRIVGVAPPAFTDVFHATFDDLDLSSLSSNARNGPRLFVPWYQPRQEEFVKLIGRMKPGTEKSAAEADLSRISAQFSAEKHRPVSIRVAAGDAIAPTLWTLLSGVAALFVAGTAIVLMIACDNIAILLLARIAARRREIGIRLALGATRRQLVVQLISENLLLSVLGGVGAMIVALAAARILERLPLPLTMPNAFSLTFDWRVIAYATLISLATTVLFGMRPALQAVKQDVVVSLNPGAFPDEASHSAIRSTLVITQITVCSALLITATVLVRSQKAPEPLDRGFSASHVLLAAPIFDARADKREFYNQLLPRLDRRPGIVAASVAETGPIPGQLDGGRWDRCGSKTRRAAANSTFKPTTSCRITLERSASLSSMAGISIPMIGSVRLPSALSTRRWRVNYREAETLSEVGCACQMVLPSKSWA